MTTAYQIDLLLDSRVIYGNFDAALAMSENCGGSQKKSSEREKGLYAAREPIVVHPCE